MVDEIIKRNVIKLPVETRKRLTTLDSLIEQSENAINSLERLGQDVTALKADLEKTKEQRRILLEDFD